MCNKNLQLPNKPTRVGTFADRLVRYVRERFRGDAPFVYTAAWIDRRTWSAIITDPQRPVAKRTALQLALALRLTRTETDELLLAASSEWPVGQRIFERGIPLLPWLPIRRVRRCDVSRYVAAVSSFVRGRIVSMWL